jgi:hypothetical protein
MDEDFLAGPARAEQDLWQRTLQQIPTLFGRLIYLARLRNAETDCYEHHGLRAVFGEEEAEAALRNSHQQVLEMLLALPMDTQRGDLDRCLEEMPQAKRRTVGAWLRTKPYLQFLPPGSSDAQKELFEANVLLLLRSFKEAKRAQGES